MIRKIRWWSMIFTSILVLIFLFSTLFVYIYSQKDDTQKADVAIVLGAAVWGDEPSPVFKERIEHSIYLYESGYVDHIIFTGGKYNEETPSESSVAKEYAIRKGVKKEDIFIEETSKVTVQNIDNAKTIMDELGFENALIVSDPLHMSRSMTIANLSGIESYTSPTPHSAFQSWETKLPFLMHESIYLSSYLLLFPTISLTNSLYSNGL